MTEYKIKKLEIFYQPKVELKTNKFIGAEALARFTSYSNSLISTDSVINSARSYEDMVNLTTAVVKKVIADFKYIESLSREVINVSINISSVEIENENLSSWVNSLFIGDTKRYIKYIEFEITERNKVLDIEKLQSGINTLKGLGFKVSIDDIGAGHNTIDLIGVYDVDYIKLDRSLINCVLENNLIDGFNYLRKIIELSHASNKKVIAEGIEDIFTYKSLNYLNCDYGQGFYISKPISIIELLELMDKTVF